MYYSVLLGVFRFCQLVSLLEETERIEKEVLLKRKTLEMLPSARDNINRLQEMSTAGTQRLLELAQEWDRHRQPMVEMQNEKEDLLNKVQYHRYSCSPFSGNVLGQLYCDIGPSGASMSILLLANNEYPFCLFFCSAARRAATWWKR